MATSAMAGAVDNASLAAVGDAAESAKTDDAGIRAQEEEEPEGDAWAKRSSSCSWI